MTSPGRENQSGQISCTPFVQVGGEPRCCCRPEQKPVSGFPKSCKALRFASYLCETVNAETHEPECEPPPPVKLVAFRLAVPAAMSVKITGLANVTKYVPGQIPLKMLILVDGATLRTGLGLARRGKSAELLVTRTAHLSRGSHTVVLSVQARDGDMGGLLVNSSSLAASSE